MSANILSPSERLELTTIPNDIDEADLIRQSIIFRAELCHGSIQFLMLPGSGGNGTPQWMVGASDGRFLFVVSSCFR